MSKTLDNSDLSSARDNVTDLKTVGNADGFRLLFKASSEKEGWMKSTKGMQTPHGVVVQVTTQQRNWFWGYSVAEALVFVPGAKIVPDSDNKGGRILVAV